MYFRKFKYIWELNFVFRMQKVLICLAVALLTSLNIPVDRENTPIKEKKTSSGVSECDSLYQEMQLEGKVSFQAFEYAYEGYKKLNIKNSPFLTLVDYTRPSTEKRFYVLDMKFHKILYQTYVAHGRNSGEKYATSFSNQDGSHKSSLGFFRTENTYIGSNGYSLVLDGLEEGINNLAKARAIVIHGADYCSESIIRSTGRLGRSYGCPALPRMFAKPIIDTIKGGSILFIYAQQQDYLANSHIIKLMKNLG